MAANPQPASPRSILLVDDHPVVRGSLASLLTREFPKCRFLEAGDADEALAILALESPDLILSDISLPGINGIQLLKKIRERWPTIPVVMLSVHDDSGYIEWALEAGASGYVTKSDAPEELRKAILSALARKPFLSPVAAGTLAAALSGDPPSWASHLTPREVEVMDLLERGLRLVDIADKTGTSPRTISTHKRRLFDKMGWGNDRDMFAFLVGKGFVS